jgi:F-type H+-transporting ATPase subunit gamma
MASAKDLKKKIRSISNTKKITRTMEMVAAAKSKKTQRRVEANTPYAKKVAELLESLSGAGRVEHYLLRAPEKVTRNALVVVTANRGLCGGYNTNVVNVAERWLEAERNEGRETDVSLIGKKGIARFKFRRLPTHAQYTHIEDRPSYQEAEELAQGLMERFRKDEVQRVCVISTRYYSAGVQRPALTQLLPIVPPRAAAAAAGGGAAGGGKAGEREFIFEPEPRTILSALLPFSVSNLMYRLLVEAAASEQIARRVAMKSATDNAEEVIRSYTRRYNRQRQAGITQQITEIVSGAEALA